MRIGVNLFICFVSAVVLPLRAQTQDAIRNGEPFSMRVISVRSIAQEGHVGFSKSLEVYAVSANGPTKSYVLYCTKAAPQSGQTYTALDEYVSGNYSWLHLWPVERPAPAAGPGF